MCGGSGGARNQRLASSRTTLHSTGGPVAQRSVDRVHNPLVFVRIQSPPSKQWVQSQVFCPTKRLLTVGATRFCSAIRLAILPR
jgi:hypothetical protein